MAIGTDPLQEVLTILSDSWNSGSTDYRKPNFIKITDVKRYEFNKNQDVVIAHRARPIIEPAGIGRANKHENEAFDIDIRVLGQNQEQHWLNVIEHTKSILQAQKVNPSSNFLILDFDGQAQDLSDKTHWLWRYMLPVQMKRYNVNR